MILSYEEMKASIDKMLQEACEEEGIEYDKFITAFNTAYWDIRFEDEEN